MDGSVDTLVIDEAGQVSLADALAMGTAARNVILLGDPLQLAQVSQGTHPPGTSVSVLEHLLGEAATIPPDRSVVLGCRLNLWTLSVLGPPTMFGACRASETCQDRIVSSSTASIVANRNISTCAGSGWCANSG